MSISHPSSPFYSSYPSPSLTILHSFLSFHTIYCLPLCMSFLHCNLHLLPVLLLFSSTWLATYLSCYGLPLHWLVCYILPGLFLLPVLLWFAPTLNCPLYSLYIVLLNVTLIVGCMFAFLSYCVLYCLYH